MVLSKWSWLVACGALLLARPALGEVVTLGASRDNTLYAEDGALSNGTGNHLFTGNTKDAFVRRAVIAFDIASAVPAGSTISAVTLTLFMSKTQAKTENVSLHRVLASWGEGASRAKGDEGQGGPAASGDATWTHALFSGSSWGTAGGVFSPTPSATTAVSREGAFYTWSSPAMVLDVQAWLDNPTGNHGWMLRGNEVTARTTKRFDSRDFSDQARRPQLVVTFTTVATTGACCAASGACSVVLDPGTACAGTYRGRNTSCEPNPCPQPPGACCLPNAAATCLTASEASCSAQGGTFRGTNTSCATSLCPVVLTPFVDALAQPPVAQPVSGTPGSTARYVMAIRETTQKLHRDLPETRVWGFDDGTGTRFPGPTIEAASDQPVEVTWQNDLRGASGALRTTHYLPVDTCLAGATTSAPRTVIHLHGGHVPADSDGYPAATFLPGAQAVYRYPNGQDAATLWYHDHAMGITRLNVYMGLAGFYVLRDVVESSLSLPAGEHEVPLVIQDRTFRADGTLVYPATWMEHVFGDTIVVNGKVWPYLNVARGKYRFRLLNGSGARTYRLRLSNGASFFQIGSDGGLLPAPVSLTAITLAPGERADVVVDFASLSPGTEVLLQNDAPAPFPGSAGVGVVANVMKLVVGSASGHSAPLPAALRTLTPLSPAAAVVNRSLYLEKSADSCSGSAWLIDGKRFEDITELPALGTTEIWRFENRSGVMHPIHMHLVMFQVLDRQPFELISGVATPSGPAVPPPQNEAGYKDTVQVGPHEFVRVIARFENYVGKFAYHCHMLEHEDHEMMRQFQTTTACGDGAPGHPLEGCDDGDGDLSDACPDGPSGTCQPAFCGDGFVWRSDGGSEECDDGNTTPGDGCDATCSIETAGGTGGTGAIGGVGGMSGAGGTSSGGTAGTTGGSDGGGGVGGTTGGSAGSGAQDAGVSGRNGGDAPGDDIGAGDEGGCGCRLPSRHPASAWLPLLAALAALARRRRCGA